MIMMISNTFSKYILAEIPHTLLRNYSNYLPNNFYDVPIQSLLFVGIIIIIIIVITINNFITILLLIYYGYGPAKSDTNKVARVYSQWRR